MFSTFGIIILLFISQSYSLEENVKSCCDSLILESGGMGDFYQGERLGKYIFSGQSSSGHGIYSQANGDNHLFYLASKGLWMVGPNIGQDWGGILNREAGQCPEALTSDWEYYMDWTDSWEEDWTMEAGCENSGGPTEDPNSEPCTWGSFCDDCLIWSEANGVRYCCAQNCDTGEIEVSTENGEVTCRCYH